MIIEDVIIAVPAFAKTIAARYCQNVNGKIWEEYGRRQNESGFRKGIELVTSSLISKIKKPVGKIYNLKEKNR